MKIKLKSGKQEMEIKLHPMTELPPCDYDTEICEDLALVHRDNNQISVHWDCVYDETYNHWIVPDSGEPDHTTEELISFNAIGYFYMPKYEVIL